METECTYRGSDIERQDPVFVNKGSNTSASQAGQFCNYACLMAYVKEEGLATGAAFEWP